MSNEIQKAGKLNFFKKLFESVVAYKDYEKLFVGYTTNTNALKVAIEKNTKVTNELTAIRLEQAKLIEKNTALELVKSEADEKAKEYLATIKDLSEDVSKAKELVDNTVIALDEMSIGLGNIAAKLGIDTTNIPDGKTGFDLVQERLDVLLALETPVEDIVVEEDKQPTEEPVPVKAKVVVKPVVEDTATEPVADIMGGAVPIPEKTPVKKTRKTRTTTRKK